MLGNNVSAQNNVIDMQKYSQSYAYSPKKLSDDKKKKLLDEIAKNKGRWWDYFGINLQRFRDDKYFYMGDLMWDSVSFTNYTMLGKIPYTFNLLKPIIRQLQGEVASMQPSISLMPANVEKVDPSTLTLVTDFTRAEMYHTKSAAAYNACFLNQLIGGWGVLEMETDYEDTYTFNQCIKVKSEADPLLVGFDPTAKNMNKCDSSFQFKDYFMDRDDFEATFNRPAPPPGAMLGTQRQFMPIIDNKTVIVTDYYTKEFKSKTLVQLTNNDTYTISVLEADIEQANQQYIQLMAQAGHDIDNIPPLKITNRRKTKVEVIHCYKCVWDDVLEHKIWPSKHFPFIFVDANSTFQDGRQYTESFIKSAKDAQQSYNYVMSEMFNAIPRSRREGAWLTRTQAAGHEDFLRYPDRQQSHCEYNFDANVPSGPIFRPPEELPQTLFVAADRAKQAVYDAMGIMPVGGTELPNNLASVTVGRIVTQSNLTFIKILNNLFDGMQQSGESFLDMMPKIYDIERIVNVVDASGTQRSVTINTVENNKEKNMLTNICFKLQVKPIASFAIQQQELRADLYKLMESDPQFPPLIADLIASTLDTPIAPLLVQRFNTVVPPAILAKEQGKPAPPPPPPSPQAQLVVAQVQKTQAEAKLANVKAQTTMMQAQQAPQNNAMEMQQQQFENQLEMQKLQASRDETASQTEATYVNAQAEVTKAQLDHDAKITQAMAQLQKASKDAGKQV